VQLGCDRRERERLIGSHRSQHRRLTKVAGVVDGVGGEQFVDPLELAFIEEMAVQRESSEIASRSSLVNDICASGRDQ